MIAFNTKRPLFRDVRMRRAINYAIDRPALARDIGDVPVADYVPPAIRGFGQSHVYPLGSPNLAAAKSLVPPGRRTAVLYMCGPPSNTGTIIRADLALIGIAVRVEESLGCLNGPERAKLAGADMQLISVLNAEPDPSVWISAALGTEYFNPDYWNDPALARRIKRANTLSGRRRIREYSRLDKILLRRDVPFAAYGAYVSPEFFSPRVGCKVFQAAFHFVDLGALCVRR